MKKHGAFGKDIIRTIGHSRKRFVSIMLICILGVAMFSGLTAACRDLQKSADSFFDQARLHDIRIVSTMGLVEEDLDALRQCPDVSSVAGVYGVSGTAFSESGVSMDVTMQTMAGDGQDALTILEGTLPDKAGEAAVTSHFLDESGLSIGDRITITEDAQEETISVDIDDTNLNLSDDNDDTVSDGLINNDSTDNDNTEQTQVLNTHQFTITARVLDPTSVNNPDGSVSYRDAGASSYTVYITEDNILHTEDTVYMAALLQVQGASELLCYSDDYKKRIRDVRQYIEDNIAPQREQARLSSIRSKAQEELQEKESDVNEQLSDAAGKLQEASEQLADARKELDDNEQTVNEQQETLDKQRRQLRYTRAYLPADQRASIEQQLEEGQASLDEAKEQLESARKELESNEETLSERQTEYDDARSQADTAFADARAQIADLKEPDWYVQDRGSMSGYANIGSDADSIQAIADIFPVVFFIVAILVSLTTVTRMVDEERGLIGTYKALGFHDGEILHKYLVYTVMASVCGSIAGSLLAFIALPAFIFTIFRTMYLLPSYDMFFDPVMGIAGPVIFIGGIAVTTAIACRTQLRQTPASLMRPKAPRPGMRTFLERIPAVWNRLSFLNKVTFRNLFRYKGRMLMTIFGVAGCMALLLFGFGIQDSVHDLMPRQYEQTCYYDLLAAVDQEDNQQLLSYAQDPGIRSYVNCEIMTATVTLPEQTGSQTAGTQKEITDAATSGSDQEITLTMIVFPDYEDMPYPQADLKEYISMRDVSGQSMILGDEDVFITINAGNVLGFSDGDAIHVQLADLSSADIDHITLTQNYLGNYMYLRKSAFEKYFGTAGEEYTPNGILATLKVPDPGAYCDDFGKKEGILSCISTQKLSDSFATTFALINVVVYIIILMSAALAFVVLFTLQTTNISERERELATIKVLGFYDREVHQYVNKETLILTAFGIILGIPLGYAFAQTLTSILNLPSIYLAVSLHGISYAIAAGLSFGFAVIVDLISNRVLNQIDPVTALKSVE